jgi:signal transduction histidine kinase
MVEKSNILVIDDEIGTREALKTILKPYYNVYAAEHGAVALEMLRRIPVDLVTVDLRMPGMSGIQVLEDVKKHDSDIEAIVITGFGSYDSALAGLRLGAFDYISKPFDVKDILELVRRAVHRRQSRLKLRQLKSDFLGNISHELRTPLSVVIGFVSLLLDEPIGNLTPEQLGILERVHENSEELLEQIDNLLCVASLNAGEVALAEEKFDVAAMIHQTIRRYERLIEQKGIRLAVDIFPESLFIVSDLSKLTRIFQSLLQNAIKFTPAGEVAVRVRRSGSERMIEFEIADTGIGIPADQIESMFHPFRQLDGSPQREFPGLGLGLTLARKLTEFLGGTLEIKSELDCGTRVLLKIPFRWES